MSRSLHLKTQVAQDEGPDGALWNKSALKWNIPGASGALMVPAFPPDYALYFYGFWFPVLFMKVLTDFPFRNQELGFTHQLIQSQV